MAHEWIVERTTHRRFPFRIRIEGPGRTVLAVRAQSPWPGAGSQIFCLRETAPPPAGEALEPVERVPVAHLARLGRKLSVTLDRPTRKRCEFLKIEQPQADGSLREQIFLRTQAAAVGHRSAGRIEIWPAVGLSILIDSAERYPWRFPGSQVARRRLPVGDYALLEGERLQAVVERKSLENLLKDVSHLRGLHQTLAELASHAHAALVVEARYEDFADAKRVGAWQPNHLLRVLAEVQVLHPRVPLVFAGSRRSANVWTQRFFAAVAGRARQAAPGLGDEEAALFDAPRAEADLDTRMREAALLDLPDGFSLAALGERFPAAPPERVRRVVHALRAEQRVECRGRGRSARWWRVAAPAPAVPPASS
jgi:hypothetical protein